jgi:hypothetical protein
MLWEFTPRFLREHRLVDQQPHGLRVGQQAARGGGADLAEGIKSELERVFRHR